jgi:hypothetical protein
MTRLGPHRLNKRVAKKARATASADVAAIMAGSSVIGKMDRKNASRVALAPTWKAIMAAAVAAAATTPERRSRAGFKG